MKGIGQGFVFFGVLFGLDSAGMGGTPGEICAALAIFIMVLGVVLIRWSKP